MSFLAYRAGYTAASLATALARSNFSVMAQDLVLEEVTVTAKKTEVTLQDAAIAVSVTSGSDFDASNIMKPIF